MRELPLVHFIRKKEIKKELEKLSSKEDLTNEIDAQLKIQEAESGARQYRDPNWEYGFRFLKFSRRVRDLGDFDKRLKKAGDKLIVVYFYNSAISMDEDLLTEVIVLGYPFNRVLILTVDLEKESLRELLNRYKLDKLPTVYLIRKGEIRKQLVGLRYTSVLTTEIDEQLRIQDAER